MRDLLAFGRVAGFGLRLLGRHRLATAILFGCAVVWFILGVLPGRADADTGAFLNSPTVPVRDPALGDFLTGTDFGNIAHGIAVVVAVVLLGSCAVVVHGWVMRGRADTLRRGAHRSLGGVDARLRVPAGDAVRRAPRHGVGA